MPNSGKSRSFETAPFIPVASKCVACGEQFEAAMHGAEYTPRLSHVRAGYVRTTSGAIGLAEAEAQFARWLETVRAEAKAEAFVEMASEPELMHGSTSYVSTDRLLELANQLRKMIFNESQ